MSTPLDDLAEQTQWDGFWLPPWATVVDRPELRYTFSAVDQPGLNQVVRVRPDDADGRPVDLEALVAEVDAAHRGVMSRWILAPRSQLDGLPDLLEAAGWRRGKLHHLRALDVSQQLAPPRDGVVARPVDDAMALRDCIDVAVQAFGVPSGPVPSERIDNELAAIAGGRVHRFVAYDVHTDEPLSSGGLNTFPELGVGFLWGGGTVPGQRGRGAYRAVLGARVDRARREGCGHVVVYAQHDTSDPILAALGFVRHGSMWTWTRSAD